MPRRRQKHHPPTASSSTDQDQSHIAPYQTSDTHLFQLDVGMQLEAHEILHHLRGIVEWNHRSRLYGPMVERPFSMTDLPRLQRGQAIGFFNKTVPIYMLEGDKNKRGLTNMLSITLHNYLYKKWFRPYRSDIELGQFIAKVIDVHGQPESIDEATAVDVAMTIRSTINAQLFRIPPRPFYTIPALFEALVVVIPAESYCICSSIANISTMTVLMLLTGETVGLSGPISFDSIENEVERVTIRGMHGVRTRLEVAVDFIMFMELREAAVFGPQPDPVAAAASDPVIQDIYGLEPMYCFERRRATQLGWKYGPIVGPSSKWVSMERYPKWTGAGAGVDMLVYQKKEERAWSMHRDHCSCYSSQKTEEVNEEVTI
ncbi:hypothetical protein ACHAPO_010383 [Fusarium lateritium]